MANAGQRRAPGGLHHWWLTGCVLTLIIASDFDFRTRPPGEALSAQIDVPILVELGLYGAVALYLLLNHAGHFRLRSVHPAMYFASLYVGLIFFSLAYTPTPEYALVRVGQTVVLLILAVVAGSQATRGDFHRLAHGYIVLIAGSVAYGVVRPAVPLNHRQAGRFTWMAIHPTVSGVLMGIAVLLVLSYVLFARGARPGPTWPLVTYVALLVMTGAGLLGSQTRGAILGTLTGALILVLASRRHPRARVETMLVIVVVVVGAALLAGGLVSQYFARGSDPEELASLSSRTDLWNVAIDAFEANPMFGYGVTSSRGLFYEETGLGGGHNAVVNVLVELGAVGLVTWAAMIGSIIVGCWRLRPGPDESLRHDRALLLALMAFLLVDSVTYEGIGAVTNVAFTWLLVCLAWFRAALRAPTGDHAPGPSQARPRAVAWANPRITPSILTQRAPIPPHLVSQSDEKLVMVHFGRPVRTGARRVG